MRTLEKLKSTAKELEKKKSIKISPNQLAMTLIDIGLDRNLGELEELEEEEERENRLLGVEVGATHQAANHHGKCSSTGGFNGK